MSLYTRVPSIFSNVIVNTSTNQMQVKTNVEKAETRICLSGNVNGVYKQYVFTDLSNATFNEIPEIYTLVISKPNYIPYILTNDSCMLQNQVIRDSRIYNGCNVFAVGSDITSIQPYGIVTIENGGDVVINVGDTITIKNDFEVKLGGKLLIQ